MLWSLSHSKVILGLPFQEDVRLDPGSRDKKILMSLVYIAIYRTVRLFSKILSKLFLISLYTIHFIPKFSLPSAVHTCYVEVQLGLFILQCPDQTGTTFPFFSVSFGFWMLTESKYNFSDTRKSKGAFSRSAPFTSRGSLFIKCLTSMPS